MSERSEAPGGGKGCGCQAALGFIILVGLPLLFVYSFGLSPCEGGRPCDPNGMRNLLIVAAVVAGLAIAIWLGVWRLVDWWSRRQAARGKDGRRQIELAAFALLLLAAAAMAALIML